MKRIILTFATIASLINYTGVSAQSKSKQP